MKLKTKLSIGLLFLFIVILLFGVLGLFTINRLAGEADTVLKNNHESLLYCNQMLTALEMVPIRKDALSEFEQGLVKQEHNITEAGEAEATAQLRKDFMELSANVRDSSNYSQLRQSIIRIQDLNELAIQRKNAAVQKTAATARLWLTVIFTIFTLISFTLLFNLPGIVSGPIRSLADGISAIAGKDYRKRIYLPQQDEFGDLANAFNLMAEKLDEYENSNIAKMQFEKSRIETIINQMKDGIVGLDARKNILFLNEVAQRLLGLQQAAIAGKYAPDIALTNDLMRKLLQEDAAGPELRIYADNKESFFTKDTLSVTSNGTVIGEVIVLKNITSFHELNQAKTNFIATVSHELKTPISAIKMSAQLLKDSRVGKLNTEQQELIKGITDDAERLLSITGELLNLSQVETGNIQLRLQPTAPGNIIEQAVLAVQVQAQQKGITIAVEVKEPVPKVQADEVKTSWVLINLLTNAIKYAPPQSTVTLSAYRQDAALVFAVEDHGQGIDEQYLPHIFDRFYKVPGTVERVGSGLGLAISKEFIEAQGGHIAVSSSMGKGSRFECYLPLSQ
ncbi:MAG TPA: ATP-binding protein [Chitinophagaceae bacterium]|nr:ATP-binding protein [Chitinophagaceae bacterium]